MANQDVRVSALQSANTLSTEDLALATVVDELSETGYTSKKITEGAKASQYLEAFTFANLNTSAKTIVGAINEAATTGGSDEFIIHMTDTTVTETAADIIDAFDGGLEIWLESQITGEAVKARLPLLAYISDSSQLVLRFSGITYASNRYRYCDVQMLRSPEQIVGRQAINVTFAVIDDATTSASSVWSSQKTASELAGKAEIDDTATDTETTWSSSRIVELLPTDTASGAVASFETPLTLPLVSHNVTIEPLQEGTGDPSPSNVRPISGWSAVTISHSGVDTSEAEEVEIALGQTIYGGELDVTNGVLKVTHQIVDLGNLNWTYNATQSRFFSSDLNGLAVFVDKYAQTSKIICDSYKTVSFDDIVNPANDNCVGAIHTTADYVSVRDLRYSDAVLFKAGVTGVKLVYILATPVEVTLTPEHISTLKGVNNVWADTGDTAIEFKQDIQTYVDSRLSSGTRSLSLAKAPVETKEETKQEEQEGDGNVDR